MARPVTIRTEHIVEIRGVRFDRPSVIDPDGRERPVFPHECRIRRLTRPDGQYDCNECVRGLVDPHMLTS